MPKCCCTIRCQNSTLYRLFGCDFLVWRHYLRKVVSKSLCTFQTLFSAIFLFLMFLNIHIDLIMIILKTHDQQFTLTTKKSLHIFKARSERVRVMDDENGEWTEEDDVMGVGRGKSEIERLGRDWFQRQGEVHWEERSVVCIKDDVDGRARLTRDEEQVLQGGWTEMRLCRYGGWELCKYIVGCWYCC